MANNFTGPIWRIDTVFTTASPPVKLVNVVWNEAATIGDQAIITTKDGRTLVDSKANQVNYSQSFSSINWASDGIKVPTLTSGVLLISIGSGK